MTISSGMERRQSLKMYKYKYVPYAAYELAMETGNGKKKEAEEKRRSEGGFFILTKEENGRVMPIITGSGQIAIFSGQMKNCRKVKDIEKMLAWARKNGATTVVYNYGMKDGRKIDIGDFLIEVMSGIGF